VDKGSPLGLALVSPSSSRGQVDRPKLYTTHKSQDEHTLLDMDDPRPQVVLNKGHLFIMAEVPKGSEVRSQDLRASGKCLNLSLECGERSRELLTDLLRLN